MLKFIGLGIFFVMICLIAGDAYYNYVSKHNSQIEIQKASVSSLTYKSETEKGKSFDELKYYHGLSDKLNFTSESLEVANKLAHGQTLSPEESLVACYLLFKIRDQAESNHLEPEILNQNRLATIAIMDKLLRQAKDSKFIREEISLAECRLYLSKLYDEESEQPDCINKSELKEKSDWWKKTANNDPKEVIRNFKKKNGLDLPVF